MKEAETDCTLDKIISDSKIKYLCKVFEDTKNIKQIKIEPDFDFTTQENITLIGISPIAYIFAVISNSTIYLMIITLYTINMINYYLIFPEK